jgi:autotransporter translocation and assembly factor TamB
MAVLAAGSLPSPKDEVMSCLLFNRSMGELTPLQLARLAGAAAEDGLLTGHSID